MNNSIITEKEILEFEAFLRSQERERATIEKYLREVRFFAGWMDGRPVTKEAVIRWKESLQKQEYVPATINAKLSALNGFFYFMGWSWCRVKFLRIQRQMFRTRSRELTRQEYYLPTTVKLLEAYAELSAQPVQGENIKNSQKEIEATLDTLNEAFERLFDSLFQDTMWDVSTDISVLKTILAQEGLSKDGLTRSKAE